MQPTLQIPNTASSPAFQSLVSNSLKTAPKHSWSVSRPRDYEFTIFEVREAFRSHERTLANHTHSCMIDPGSVITFQTKCNNNLTVDNDPNYFASSALDHPGIMIWDRRATSRPVASPGYLQAVDEDELPWGGALRLDRVIETDSDPFLAEGKHSLIRSLKYSRDQCGLLAVLSRTGQLKVLQTNKENPTVIEESGPELLQVQKSHEMDVSYVETSRKNDRIVAFDWIPLGSTVLRPRLLVLRANGNFDILEQPSNTADHVFKLVPWQAPHRGLEGVQRNSLDTTISLT